MEDQLQFVSIDVGIKNLSFCFFEMNKLTKDYHILKWDNIDLTEKETKTCCESGCKKPVKFSKNDKMYCLTHSKKQPYIKPPTELKLSSLNKMKMGQLVSLLEKYKIQTDENVSIKKKGMIDLLIEYANKTCFDPIVSSNATKVDLVVIGKNIQHKFDIIFGDYINTIQTIIIENQIGPLANKMKTIQGMLSQYFIMKNNNIRIDFINASNKLKGLTTPEVLDYKGRKKMGIQFCMEKISEDWKPFFKEHKKKDDLSDCFLQGVWYISNVV